METKTRDPRHFIKGANNLAEASCTGRYMGVRVEKILLNARVSGDTGAEVKEKDFTLIRVLYSNLWDYRLSTDFQGTKMIDTEGIQHSHETNMFVYGCQSKVRLSRKEVIPYDFDSPQNNLEGRAKTRGWLWFPSLSRSVFPHRLIFNFYIFAPGCLSGVSEDRDTIEIVFQLRFGELLPEAKKFTTLDIGDFGG